MGWVMAERIKRSDLFRILLRCFLVQGSWNYQSMIGLGFCYCALPILKRLYKSPEDQEEFLRRHLEFFNAHPYFVGWCLGAVARLEEDAERKNWIDYRPIRLFKERLTGPLGSIGDQLFWDGIKPASAAIGVWIAIICGWIALPIFLIIYNIPHLYFRIKGLFLSYKKGFDIVSNISERRYRKTVQIVKVIGLIGTGLAAGAGAHQIFQKDYASVLSFLTAMLIAYYFCRLEKSINLALIIISVVTVVIGFVLNF